VPIFGKKPPKIIVCPICTARFDAPEESVHWGTHVTQIPDGQGEHAGKFTWTCVCGPTDMIWPNANAAASGLALHMQQRHNIPL
jgi:hypothetical protein